MRINNGVGSLLNQMTAFNSFDRYIITLYFVLFRVGKKGGWLVGWLVGW